LPDGLSALDLIALRSGPTGRAGVAVALLAAAAVPVLTGRRWRLGWAARAWVMVLASGAVVWAREQGGLTTGLPDAGVVLAPAAAGLALAVALGVSAVEHDLRGRSWRFGLRRLVAAAGALALCAAPASTLGASVDGWWDMPRDDFAGLLGFVDEDVRAGPARVVWVGDAELLPGGDGWQLDDRLSYTAATASVLPGVADLWPATSDGASERLGEALALAMAHDTARLGRLLAPMGVEYVAVPQRLAPSHDAPVVAGSAPADALVEALGEQLDLERMRVDRSVVLYRNTAAAPLRSVFDGHEPPRVTAVAGLDRVVLPAEPVLEEQADARSARGEVPDGTTVVQATTASDNWRLTVDGRPVDHEIAFGWADAFTVETGGAAEIDYRTPTAARAAVVGQALLWVLALGVALRMRFGAGEPPPATTSSRRAGAPSREQPPDTGGTEPSSEAGGTGEPARTPAGPDAEPAADPDREPPDREAKPVPAARP
jgi:hypothetical protein